MKKTVKAFRVAALLSVMGGASALLVSATTPAKAGEERLHGSTFKTYGLVPPGESNKGSTNSGAVRSASTDAGSFSKSTVKGGAGKASKGSSASTADNEPKLEDPPMPTYDGPNGGGNNMANNEGAVSSGFN